eukprot:SAG11_NODE_163_length_13928_cov_29.869188_10_plen_88_part_00
MIVWVPRAIYMASLCIVCSFSLSFVCSKLRENAFRTTQLNPLCAKVSAARSIVCARKGWWRLMIRGTVLVPIFRCIGAGQSTKIDTR